MAACTFPSAAGSSWTRSQKPSIAKHSTRRRRSSRRCQARERHNVPACWLNGRSVDPRTPVLSVFERGFLFADGVFETIRAARGVMIQLDAHLDRLFVGLERLKIPVPPHLDAS